MALLDKQSFQHSTSNILTKQKSIKELYYNNIMNHLFYLSLGLTALAAASIFINFIVGMNPDSEFFRSRRVIIVHCISCIIYIAGVVGTIGFGVAWIVQSLSN